MQTSEANLQPAKTRSRRVRSAIWLAISGLAAGWIVWRSRDDVELLTDAGTAFVLGMIGLNFVSLLTQSERFRVVLHDHTGTKLPLVNWLRLFARGRLFSFILPQSGNVYRGMALYEDHQTPVSRYVSSLATQTWLSVVLSLLVAVALAWIAAVAGGTSVGAGEALTISIATAGLIVAPYPLVRFRRSLPGWLRRSRIAGKASEILDLATKTVKNPRLLVAFVALVVTGFGASALALVMAFEIAGGYVPLTTAAVMMAFVYVSNLVALTPGNLGVQELGLAALAGAAGYPLALGVLASVVMRMSNIVAVVVMATLSEAWLAVAKPPRTRN